jgi:hypothetical protein
MTFTAALLASTSHCKPTLVRTSSIAQVQPTSKCSRALLYVVERSQPSTSEDAAENAGAPLARRYLQYWNSSFPAYLASVDGSAVDATAGNRTALLADVNILTFPDGSCVPAVHISP